MRVRAKWWLVCALPACAMLVGLTDRTPERLIDGDSLFSTFIAATCVALVFFWYRVDAKERAYRRTWGLGIAMVLITALALPWYMIRSRPGARGLATLAKATGVFILCGLVYGFSSTAGAAEIVNDVTQLNPIQVEAVVAPQTMEELVTAVTSHAGPVSIGGGRYSMGGQTATPGGVQIDMRRFNQVLSFSPERKEITVQAGITWRAIQEYIDASDLSLQIMQTYANFTVGGALSVNAHGRYIGMGPLVLSVKSIRLVLASGEVVLASPTERSELFYGAIGGYGSLGVIAEATLSLTDNVRVERRTTVMPLASYGRFFAKQVRDNSDVVFHNADIYPDAYDTVRATSYLQTDKPVTVKDRLIPKVGDYGMNRRIYQMITEWPGGRWARQHVVDPMVFRGNRVVWRNYEASYDVAELEPASRKDSSYVLQEYFVPVEKLDAFVPTMGEILNRHKVNVVNISIRHAKADPGTTMAWARHEVFAFVLYYKQGTDAASRAAVGPWTRELIEAAVSYGGAYYLPYQVLATPEQFHAAYPNAGKLFTLKRQVDPGHKFRNTLWNAYYDPASDFAPPAAAEALPLDTVHNAPGYRRDEAQTFLTLPEWVLVYSPAEYAQWLNNRVPSGYPYFRSIGQFWGYYRDAWQATRKDYPFNVQYHVMVSVIGSSYTVENGVKGLYENTVGRVSEWSAHGKATAEDRAAAAFAQRYVDFIRVRPWYEFSFFAELKRLWRETPLRGAHPLRKLERRLVLSAELLVKAQYATLLTVADEVCLRHSRSRGAGGDQGRHRRRPDASRGHGQCGAGRGRCTCGQPSALRGVSRRRRAAHRAGRALRGHRGERPDPAVGGRPGAVVSRHAWRGRGVLAPDLIDPSLKRVGLTVPVTKLDQVVGKLDAQGLAVEHIYDY